MKDGNSENLISLFLNTPETYKYISVFSKKKKETKSLSLGGRDGLVWPPQGKWAGGGWEKGNPHKVYAQGKKATQNWLPEEDWGNTSLKGTRNPPCGNLNKLKQYEA